MCPAYKRYFVPKAIVFLTLATAGRKPIFQDASRATAALEILKNVKSTYPFIMKGYVVMPDHWHLLIQTEDGRFDRIIHSFKRHVSFEFHSRGLCQGDIWQKRYYDHVVRDDTDFVNHLDYIHFNPVHHGKASRPAGHLFSSFHKYVERGRYQPDWGDTVPEHVKEMNLE